MIKTNWDLTHIFKSNEEFESAFLKVQELAKELEKFKGQFKNDDKNMLLKYFKLNDEYDSLFEKVFVYARCKSDEDGKNDVNIRNYMSVNNFYAIACEKLAFLRCEIHSLDEKYLSSLLTDPDFVNYTRSLKSIIDRKKHTPSEVEEQLLSAVSGFSNHHDIFSTLTDIEMTFSDVVDDDGKTVKLTGANYNSLLKSKKQEVRKNVMDTYLAEYKKHNLTISNLYLSNIKHVNLVAKVNKFNSALQKDCFENELDENIMLKNLEYVSKNASLIQRFFKLKKQILGLDEFYSCDINADILNCLKESENEKKDEVDASKDQSNDENNDDLLSPVMKSFISCVEDIKNSLASLGKDYQYMFEKALEDGWIDVMPKDNKASGGYTISAYLLHPYILLNYDGTDYWRSAITHEFGHAMHSYYSSKAQPYAKSGYTIFIAEVASLTNEVLLSKYLLKKETDKIKKIQILSNFLSLFYLNVFNTAILAEFEYISHEKAWNNETMTANDFNELFKSISEKYYGDSVKFTENFVFDWERRSHIFRDYYLYKYSTGLISACAIASKILNDTTGEYVKKYKEFLSIGDSMGPLESLKVADIDITNEETYNFAFSIFDEYLNEMKKLYEEN